MQIRDSNLDKFLYILLCFVTLGMAFVVRIIISEAIRQAMSPGD